MESHILLAGLYPKAFLLSSLTFFRNSSNYEELYKTLQRLEVNMSSELPSFLEAVQHKEPGEFVQTV